MLIHKVALVALLFLRTVPSSDCLWRNAVKFWSNVVCSIEHSKTVNFYGVLDNSRNWVFLEQYFQALIYGVLRKCETTIMSRTYALRDSKERTSFVDNNDILGRAIVRRSSIWKITPDDALPHQIMPSTAERIRNDKIFAENTWNVHVILTGDVHSFDQISKDDSTFRWNPRDRFIVLIARQEEYGLRTTLNALNSRIDDILKTLWSKRKVQSVFVSEATFVNDTTRINQVIRTYNPFAKVNDSVWGKAEIINIETVEEASNVLSHQTYRRMKNLNGYELKVGLLKKGQAIAIPMKLQSSMHYAYSDFSKGFDEIMLDTIARHMNFNAKQTYPTDNKSFGHRLPDGTYDGVIGDMVHGRTDICFVSFFIKKYGANTATEDVEFTTYVDFDRLCLVVPKATKIPKGLRIYHFFPLSIWICSTLSHVLTYLTWYFLQVFTPKRTERIGLRATIYRSFLLNVGCPQKLPSTDAERILLSGIFLANVTLVGIFGGMLYNSFAEDMYYPDIDSLHDFDVSGLPILSNSFSLGDLFGSDNDVYSTSLMQNLRKKLQYGLNSVNNAAYHRNVSGLLREYYFPVISEELIDADGGPLVHLVKECVGDFYLSYLLPKNSILQERVNTLISQLNQAGLSLLWNKRAIRIFRAQKRSLAKEKLARNDKGNDDGFVPFNLSDMQSSFYMLLIGLLISAIVFFCEKGWLKIPSSRIGKSNPKSTR